MAKRISEIKRENGLSDEDAALLTTYVGENLATVIHDSVFLPAVGPSPAHPFLRTRARAAN